MALSYEARRPEDIGDRSFQNSYWHCELPLPILELLLSDENLGACVVDLCSPDFCPLRWPEDVGPAPNVVRLLKRPIREKDCQRYSLHRHGKDTCEPTELLITSSYSLNAF